MSVSNGMEVVTDEVVDEVADKVADKVVMNVGHTA